MICPSCGSHDYGTNGCGDCPGFKVGDRVRDWQGAVEGCGIGTVEVIEDEVATVRFSNVVADLPVSHLEVVSTWDSKS